MNEHADRDHSEQEGRRHPRVVGISPEGVQGDAAQDHVPDGGETGTSHPAAARATPAHVDEDDRLTPAICRLDKGDLGHIVDALMDAADRRRDGGGRLQERIADHLDELAIRLHYAKPDAITEDPA